MSGCGGNDPGGENHAYHKRGPIKVKKPYDGKNYPIDAVCTTGMVADLVRKVGGKHVKVTQLMKPGVDPHLYSASSGDVSKLNSADVIFYSGLHLEGKMTDILDNLSRRRPVFAVAEYFEPKELIHVSAGVDPHVWFDVELWNKARSVVQKALIKFDPMHADDYHKAGETYGNRLKALHERVKSSITLDLPDRKKRILVTSHDAFGYFAKKYEFTVKAVQGISTVDEAGIRRIKELVDFIAEKKIKAIFVESSVNERNMKSLIDGCKNDHGHTVKIGGTLFSDAMGEEGTNEENYVGMIDHNIRTIVEALK